MLQYYEAYSESKFRPAVKKKSSKVSYKILLLSDSTFFKLFSHIFVAIIEALNRSGEQVFVYPRHRMRPPAMLATSALHLSGHRGESLKSEKSAVTDQKL